MLFDIRKLLLQKHDNKRGCLRSKPFLNVTVNNPIINFEESACFPASSFDCSSGNCMVENKQTNKQTTPFDAPFLNLWIVETIYFRLLIESMNIFNRYGSFIGVMTLWALLSKFSPISDSSTTQKKKKTVKYTIAHAMQAIMKLYSYQGPAHALKAAAPRS